MELSSNVDETTGIWVTFKNHLSIEIEKNEVRGQRLDNETKIHRSFYSSKSLAGLNLPKTRMLFSFLQLKLRKVRL